MLGFLFVQSVLYFGCIINERLVVEKFQIFKKFNNKLECFVTTTKLGNLALHSGDDKDLVLGNRQKLADILGISQEQFIFLDQTHSSNVFIAKKEDAGKGVFDKEGAITDTDAIVTDSKRLCLFVLVADCVPIVLFDEKRSIIAAVHSGWKGTAERIVQKVVQKMQNKFGSTAEDILVGIGPAIGPCCFEVQSDVFSIFQDKFGVKNLALKKRENGDFIDLWELNRQILLKEGILSKNIEILSECTACNSDKFFSVRAGAGAGRIAVGVYLK